MQHNKDICKFEILSVKGLHNSRSTSALWLPLTQPTYQIKYVCMYVRNVRIRRHSKCFKTKLIARLVLRQKGKICWPIFQLAELVFFRANKAVIFPLLSIGPEED